MAPRGRGAKKKKKQTLSFDFFSSSIFQNCQLHPPSSPDLRGCFGKLPRLIGGPGRPTVSRVSAEQIGADWYNTIQCKLAPDKKTNFWFATFQRPAAAAALHESGSWDYNQTSHSAAAGCPYLLGFTFHSEEGGLDLARGAVKAILMWCWNRRQADNDWQFFRDTLS